MLRKSALVGLGLILFAIGAYFFPLGSDVLLWLAILVMGSYWGGILLTYAWTSALAIAGLLLVFKPNLFYRPAGFFILVIAVIATVVLTIVFAGGRI